MRNPIAPMRGLFLGVALSLVLWFLIIVGVILLDVWVVDPILGAVEWR